LLEQNKKILMDEHKKFESHFFSEPDDSRLRLVSRGRFHQNEIGQFVVPWPLTDQVRNVIHPGSIATCFVIIVFVFYFLTINNRNL
jgi:hypothetical protein